MCLGAIFRAVPTIYFETQKYRGTGSVTLSAVTRYYVVSYMVPVASNAGSMLQLYFFNEYLVDSKCC